MQRGICFSTNMKFWGILLGWSFFGNNYQSKYKCRNNERNILTTCMPIYYPTLGVICVSLVIGHEHPLHVTYIRVLCGDVIPLL